MKLVNNSFYYIYNNINFTFILIFSDENVLSESFPRCIFAKCVLKHIISIQFSVAFTHSCLNDLSVKDWIRCMLPIVDGFFLTKWFKITIRMLKRRMLPYKYIITRVGIHLYMWINSHIANTIHEDYM